MKLRKIRTLLACLFFVALTLLFLDFTGTLRHCFGWMAKVQLLPAVLALNVVVVGLLLVLTLVFGRIYCSVVCPLGVFQDVAARFGRVGRRNPYGYSKEKRLLRYGVFAAFVVSLVLGFRVIFTLLAPYSSYGRMVQSLFQPVYELLNNLLAIGAERADSYVFYQTEVWMRSGIVFAISLITFFGIGFFAFRHGRTYCNTICPVGTFLSFFARFAWFRVAFDTQNCRKCGMCAKNCKAAAIDFKNMKVDYSRCVVCGDCLDYCKFDSLHYVGRGRHKALQDAACTEHDARKVTSNQAEKPRAGIKKATVEAKTVADASETAVNAAERAVSAAERGGESPDSSRRHFLLAAALATTAAATAQKEKKVDGGMAEIVGKEPCHRKTLVTPPGSLSARNMASRCTSCQLCVAECPNGVLRPSTDLSTFMQPTMSFERGYCRPECTRCADVCPAGAIQPITKAEKTAIHIGHAVWLKANCVAITDGVECGNCARHCPAGAIVMVPYQAKDGEVMVPAVDETRCLGCGACENLCPARPFSAIYVEGHEVHRKG